MQILTFRENRLVFLLQNIYKKTNPKFAYHLYNNACDLVYTEKVLDILEILIGCLEEY